MTVKIAVTLEYEDEKWHFHSNRLLLFLLLKKLTALSDIFFNFMELCTWLLTSYIEAGAVHVDIFHVTIRRCSLMLWTIVEK